jgi:hypothetical protein
MVIEESLKKKSIVVSVDTLDNLLKQIKINLVGIHNSQNGPKLYRPIIEFRKHV